MQYNHLGALELTKQIMIIDTDHSLTAGEKEQRKQALCMAYNTIGGPLTQSIVSPYFNAGADTVDLLVG